MLVCSLECNFWMDHFEMLLKASNLLQTPQFRIFFFFWDSGIMVCGIQWKILWNITLTYNCNAGVNGAHRIQKTGSTHILFVKLMAHFFSYKFVHSVLSCPYLWKNCSLPPMTKLQLKRLCRPNPPGKSKGSIIERFTFSDCQSDVEYKKIKHEVKK